jgi:pimeloyl-ACP methyl ester carboxylesterase
MPSTLECATGISQQKGPFPMRGLAADAEAVSDLVRTIDGPVVLVAHSYGGAVISNVAGEIAGLVYVNGFAPEPGENFGLAAKFRAACCGRSRSRARNTPSDL